jgi:hypothetical protein
MDNTDHLTQRVRVSLDFSDVTPDWGQPVEIVQHGTFHDEWRLRDPDADITASGESYMETRRLLTVVRNTRRRVESAARNQLEREIRSLARQHSRVSAL